MAYIKLADGSTFNGADSDMAEAIKSYMLKKGMTDSGSFDWSKITISPEVTKIVEKVPVQVDKIIERTVQVPVLPERPLTKDEMDFIRELSNKHFKNQEVQYIACGIGGVLGLTGIIALCAYAVKRGT